MPAFPQSLTAQIAVSSPSLRAARFLGVALALCLSTAAPATAQQQDRTLLERVEKPDMTLSFGAQKTEFHGSGKGFQGGRGARVKDFYSPARFRSKDYMTGSYRTKKAWAGDFTYSTKGADTEGGGAAKRMTREHVTRSAPTRESRHANQRYRTRQHAAADRKSDFRGKSQDTIDVEGPQAVLSIPGDSGFTELKTIDDIRNLLNKN